MYIYMQSQMVSLNENHEKVQSLASVELRVCKTLAGDQFLLVETR